MSSEPQSVSERILEATARTLSAHGAANVSMREIARDAGVALGQLHYYFGSREKLLAAAVSFVMRRRIATLQDALSGVVDPVERISLALRLIRQQAVSDPDAVKMHLDASCMAIWSEELAGEIRRLQDELLAVILMESERAGLPDLKTNAVARLVLGTLDGLALQALQGAPPAEMDAAYAALASVLLSLLK